MFPPKLAPQFLSFPVGGGEQRLVDILQGVLVKNEIFWQFFPGYFEFHWIECHGILPLTKNAVEMLAMIFDRIASPIF